jgi:hypothetical protein
VPLGPEQAHCLESSSRHELNGQNTKDHRISSYGGGKALEKRLDEARLDGDDGHATHSDASTHNRRQQQLTVETSNAENKVKRESIREQREAPDEGEMRDGETVERLLCGSENGSRLSRADDDDYDDDDDDSSSSSSAALCAIVVKPALQRRWQGFRSKEIVERAALSAGVE